MLYILDAELAALLYHEPLFRHKSVTLPIPASLELFQASDAESWAAIYFPRQGRNHGTSNPSVLTFWLNVSSLNANILETRHQHELSERRIREFESSLLLWHSSLIMCESGSDRPRSHETPDFHAVLLLWHHAFINISVDLNLLEVAIGRDDSDISSYTQQAVEAWIHSDAFLRCLFHSLCIQHLGSIAAGGSTISLHAPRTLFSAALCWYCFMLYSPPDRSRDGSQTGLEARLGELEGLPEIQMLLQQESGQAAGISPFQSSKVLVELGKMLKANPSQMKASTLCILESTLRRLGSGAVARQLADVVQVFIIGETQHRQT